MLLSSSFASILTALALTSSIGTHVSFDETTFVHASSSSVEAATLAEYVPEGESIEEWSRLLSFQCHPSAKTLRDVIQPYVEARQSLIATAPEVIPADASAPDREVSIVLFLGKPGIEWLEFVIARFLQGQEFGVYAVIYSHRIPMSENVDVSEAVEGKPRWLAALGSLPPDQLANACRLPSA